MLDATALHRTAMGLYGQGLIEHSRSTTAARALFRRALQYEQQAIDALSAEPHSPDLDLARSVLMRSAATIALRCGDVDGARGLARGALALGSPRPIREELRSLDQLCGRLRAWVVLVDEAIFMAHEWDSVVCAEFFVEMTDAQRSSILSTDDIRLKAVSEPLREDPEGTERLFYAGCLEARYAYMGSIKDLENAAEAYESESYLAGSLRCRSQLAALAALSGDSLNVGRNLLIAEQYIKGADESEAGGLAHLVLARLWGEHAGNSDAQAVHAARARSVFLSLGRNDILMWLDPIEAEP